MAKKKTKKTRKEQELAKAYEARHRKNLKLYQKEIADAYREAAQEAASISSLIESAELEEAFTFASHPITHQRAARMMDKLRNSLSVAIANGVRSEWTLANNKNNELCNVVFANAAGLLGVSQYSRYYSTNQRALDAFLERKQQGLNLSERVWRYAEQFKKEIEMGIDIGLRDGLPASEMATSLKQYLQHQDKLFRRVRDEHGELHLSKAAKAFHPGQGVYRSSYKNAQRLAITEGNIAFRTADHLRMQEMDFIVGQHVILSNNHTCLGVKGVFYDICDELSGVNEDDPRGRYPKDFKFTGWHPHCRCGVTAILKTDEEIAEDTQKILNGEPLDGESVNRVNDVPEEFKGWLKDNEERISRAKSLPYFMADNEKYCQEMKITARAREGADLAQKNNAMFAAAAKPAPKTPLEIAAERHAARTPEQIEDIKQRWLDRAILNMEMKARECGDQVQSISEKIASKHGATVTPINYKSFDSIKRKVLAERKNPLSPNFMPNELKDTVRNTIITSQKEMQGIIDDLRNHPSFLRWKLQKTSLGYTGNIINLRMPNGIVAEIQVNTPEMIYAKEKPEEAKRILGRDKWNSIQKRTGMEGGMGHKYYEEYRVLNPDSKKAIEIAKKSIEYYSHFI